MAKAKVTTGGIKIQKADPVSSERREIGLVESSYVNAKGETRKTLAVTINGVVQRGFSHEWRYWETELAVFEIGRDAIREWVDARRREDMK